MVRVVNALISRWVKRAKYCAPCSDLAPSESGSSGSKSYSRIRSRSDDAVISRLPSLPIARIAVSCPLIRPYWVANCSVTRPCTVSTMPSATSANAAPGLLGGDRAGQNPRTDQEQALLTEQPQAVEELLVGISIRQRRRETRRQFAPVRHRAEEARIDQAVHDLRLPRQHVAEPGGSAENQRHQRHEVAVLAEQRDQPPAALQRLQEAVEGRDRVVGLLGVREAVDQRGNELRQTRCASLPP